MPRHTIRSILVGTDLTERTDPVLQTGHSLAETADAELHLLHAFDFQLPAVESAPFQVEDATFPGQIERAERALDEQIRRAIPQSERVTSRKVDLYIAHKSLLDQAAEVSADLIVLGPHRSRRIGDQFLGSTADRVIRTAGVPVLIVREVLRLPLSVIAAATDFSEPAAKALEEAAAWTAAFGRDGEESPPELRAVHVRVMRDDFTDPPSPLELESLEAKLLDETQDAARRTGSGTDLGVVPEILTATEPADELVLYAEEKSPDFLVLGTHGRGRVARALIGSVASSVVRRVMCPVLLVPPPHEDQNSRE